MRTMSRRCETFSKPKSGSGVRSFFSSPNSLLQPMMVFLTKALLFVLVLVVIDSVVTRSSTSLSFDPTFSTGFIMPVSANSEQCKEYDIPKPPRFGKREAYLNRYRASNKCVNSKRFTFVDTDQMIRIIQEFSRGNVKSPLAFPNSVSVDIWRKLLRDYQMGGPVNSLNRDQPATKKGLSEGNPVNEIPGSFRSSIEYS